MHMNGIWFYAKKIFGNQSYVWNKIRYIFNQLFNKIKKNKRVSGIFFMQKISLSHLVLYLVLYIIIFICKMLIN